MAELHIYRCDSCGKRVEHWEKPTIWLVLQDPWGVDRDVCNECGVNIWGRDRDYYLPVLNINLDEVNLGV